MSCTVSTIVPNATQPPFVDFGLNMLDVGLAEPTIRISVVTQPLNFTVFNRVQRCKYFSAKK